MPFLLKVRAMHLFKFKGEDCDTDLNIDMSHHRLLLLSTAMLT
jgi:hypothetical protein